MILASSLSGAVGLDARRVAGYCLPSVPVRYSPSAVVTIEGFEVGTVPTWRMPSTKWFDTPHISAIARLESQSNSLTAISTQRP